MSRCENISLTNPIPRCLKALHLHILRVRYPEAWLHICRSFAQVDIPETLRLIYDLDRPS